ncbi:hypothetical protein M1B72_00745 [Geomonas paludis]|uniref:Uncharacterized protein n=1 Tax=Geomonas paludis TaxID=2740185 RepID=A0A6V8MQ41_9BACT|nr:hypothetical protein [Geomonas paludis]UPU36261.1 hypothetical protein M1B72_00745 [Geomonas paludis]GFO62121.1 hypothetical protein GMPD_00400 [Geomonas paludis]
MNPFKIIEDLINEHGSATIRGERLLLLKDELTIVEKERADLYKKCSDLEKEVIELRDKLAKASIPPEFTEYQGALFKRDAAGSYSPIAYCPECKRPLFNTEPKIFPYSCSTRGCGYNVNIHEDLQSIANKLTDGKR